MCALLLVVEEFKNCDKADAENAAEEKSGVSAAVGKSKKILESVFLLTCCWMNTIRRIYLVLSCAGIVCVAGVELRITSAQARAWNDGRAWELALSG